MWHLSPGSAFRTSDDTPVDVVYRPPARQPQAIDTSTSHIGFRCAAS